LSQEVLTAQFVFGTLQCKQLGQKKFLKFSIDNVGGHK
jgi:hypothetical protein